MSDWTAGYVADLAYTYGYYPELNPLRAQLPLLYAGLRPPEVANACELGFGQGMSVNIHAAASNVHWWGNDFNPEQAAFARDMAAASGSGAQLGDESFAEFCTRTDLPDFDFIALHGIWSWVSDDNRALIIDFVRRKLRVGGLLYVSYNTQPGWSALMPLRHLLTQHAAVMSPPGQAITGKIDAAIGFAQKLLDLQPGYVRSNPGVVDRFAKIAAMPRNYLAHEYFNRDWDPMPFADMAAWLEPAKLTFAAAGGYIDHVDAANMNDAQAAFLKEIPDANLRETVRDYVMNQTFRRDLWVKGPRKLSPLHKAEALQRVRVMLIIPADSFTYKLKTNIGEVDLNASIYKPLLELLADHQPHDIGQLVQATAKQKVNAQHVYQAIMVMMSRSDLAVVQPDDAQPAARKRCDKLNQWIIDRARSGGDLNYLASPVTGGAVFVPRFQQLFIAFRSSGVKTAPDLVNAVWQLMAGQGQRIAKEGRRLETEEENRAELLGMADEFLTKQIPILKALKVIA